MGYKIKKSTRRKLKVRARKIGKILFKIYIVSAILFSTWQLGRWYEYKIFERHIAEFKQYTTEAFYFLEPQVVDPFVNGTSDLFITGEVEFGRCLTHEGARKLRWSQ